MIPAFIVLLVIAFALGGYIGYTVIRDKKKIAEAQTQYLLSGNADSEADILREAEAELAPDTVPETVHDDVDEKTAERKAVSKNGETRYIVIKYSKSFLAKLIQSDNETKRRYSVIKNRLLSYEGVKSRISWKWESFRIGRNTLAKLRLRGKTLSLCLALKADDYAETKYIVENLAEIKSFAGTPCVYRIKNDRRLKYSEELIVDLMRKNGLAEKPSANTKDYAALYPYEDTDALIERNLIKVLTDDEAQSGTKFKPSEIRQSITVQEADSLMQDEVAATLIEKSNGTSDRTKQSIVNIDTLSHYFSSGEIVTLKEVIKRIPAVSSKTTYIKVLARGTLNKALIVEADSFSLQAVKMIVLTGGTAIRKR